MTSTTTAAPLPMPPLTARTIHDAIDSACVAIIAVNGSGHEGWTPAKTMNRPSVMLRRAQEHELFETKHHEAAASSFSPQQQQQQSLLFGIVATSVGTQDNNDSTLVHNGDATSCCDPTLERSSTTPTTLTATFYLAYSTWDGRVLYLDQARFPVDENTNKLGDAVSSTTQQQSSPPLLLLMYGALANVAVQLQCNR
jgi:hypothetical protein